MSRTNELVDIVGCKKAEVEWTVAEKSLETLESSTRQGIYNLINAFVSTVPENRKWAKEALKKLPHEARRVIERLVKLRESVDIERERRVKAIDELGEIARSGQNLDTIVPLLVRSLTEEEFPVCTTCRETLAKIGSSAVPVLIATLSNESSLRGRGLAAWTLEGIGHQAESALPALIKALSDPESNVRNSASKAIEKIGPREEDVPFLVAALSDEKSSVDAAHFLVKMVDGTFKVNIDNVLAMLNQLAQQVVPVLLGMCAKKLDRKDFVQLLVKIGPADISTLTLALSGGDACIRRLIVEILGGIGPRARPAMTELVKCLSDSDSGVRWEVARAITAVGARPEDIPRLVNALVDTSGPIRTSVACALGEIGVVAVPTLIERMADANSCIREGIAVALGKIGARGKEAIPYLLKAFDDECIDVQKAAVAAIGGFGFEAKDTVPRLVELLKSDKLREAAALSLGEIGDPRAVGPLFGLLFASHGEYAAKALRQLAPDSTVSKEVMEDAISASGYEHLYSGRQHDAGYISLGKSNAAIGRLCSIKSAVTSNILHFVSQKRNISVTMDAGCFEPWEEVVDFSHHRQMALEELACRGSPSYDPLAFVSSQRLES